jgi:hypothetical protein
MATSGDLSETGDAEVAVLVAIKVEFEPAMRAANAANSLSYYRCDAAFFPASDEPVITWLLLDARDRSTSRVVL